MSDFYRHVPDPWSLRDETRDMERRRTALDQDLATADEALRRAEDQVRIERDKVALLQDKLAQRAALLDELSALADLENEANVLLRRAERKLDRRLNRRMDIDVQADRSRAGRMVKVMVDPQAWEAFREFNRRRNFQGIGVSVGQAVAREVRLIETDAAAGTPGDRRRRSPGEADPVPVSKSLRIFVSEDVWPVFALHVARSPLTIGRYIGELVEAAAHERGWRAT